MSASALPQVIVTLRRSLIGRPQTQRATVRALGLRKMNQSIVMVDSASLRGQLYKVRHLVGIDVIQTLPSHSSIAGSAAAETVVRIANECIAARGRFVVSFSGGSLPKLLCPSLIHLLANRDIDFWSSWYVLFTDERCVPHDHLDSSYALVKLAFFDYVPIPSSNIFAIAEPNDGFAGNSRRVADDYESRLRQLFASDNVMPCIDLVLLGMGEDGHTASLFPHHRLLGSSTRWVEFLDDSPKPPPSRITLTLPVINNARNALFLVTGEGKRQVLKRIFNSSDANDGEEYPAAHVSSNVVLWYIDEPAAPKTN